MMKYREVWLGDKVFDILSVSASVSVATLVLLLKFSFKRFILFYLNNHT